MKLEEAQMGNLIVDGSSDSVGVPMQGVHFPCENGIGRICVE